MQPRDVLYRDRKKSKAGVNDDGWAYGRCFWFIPHLEGCSTSTAFVLAALDDIAEFNKKRDRDDCQRVEVSVRTLSQWLGIGQRTVVRALHRLEALGAIECVRRGRVRGQPSVYDLVDCEEWASEELEEMRKQWIEQEKAAARRKRARRKPALK